MIRSMLICGCLACAGAGLAAQDAPRPTVKEQIKADGRAVGHGARKVGHGFKRGGTAVGHGFRDGAKDVGHGFKHAVKKD